MADIKDRIEDVLSSIDTIKRVEANPFMYEKVMFRMKNGKASVKEQTAKANWQWALAACVIVAINVAIWAAPATNVTSITATETEQFAQTFYGTNTYWF